MAWMLKGRFGKCDSTGDLNRCAGRRNIVRAVAFLTTSDEGVSTPREGVSPPKGKARSLPCALEVVGAGPTQIVRL